MTVAIDGKLPILIARFESAVGPTFSVKRIDVERKLAFVDSVLFRLTPNNICYVAELELLKSLVNITNADQLLPSYYLQCVLFPTDLNLENMRMPSVSTYKPKELDFSFIVWKRSQFGIFSWWKPRIRSNRHQIFLVDVLEIYNIWVRHGILLLLRATKTKPPIQLRAL